VRAEGCRTAGGVRTIRSPGGHTDLLSGTGSPGLVDRRLRRAQDAGAAASVTVGARPCLSKAVKRTPDTLWATNMRAAKAFHAREGHLRVPRKHEENLMPTVTGTALGRAVRTSR
jgi:hypothetical protein